DCYLAPVDNDRHWHSCPRYEARDAHLTYILSVRAPPLAVPMPLPLFSENLTNGFVFQHRFCQQLFQPGVFTFKRFQPLRISGIHATQLTTPKVITCFGKTMATAQVCNRQATIDFPQNTSNLFFCKTLLHVQSPS